MEKSKLGFPLNRGGIIPTAHPAQRTGFRIVAVENHP